MKTILGGISESLAGRVAETRLATQNIQLLTFLYHCEEKKKNTSSETTASDFHGTLFHHLSTPTTGVSPS